MDNVDRIRVQDLLNRDFSIGKIARILEVPTAQLVACIDEWDQLYPKPPQPPPIGTPAHRKRFKPPWGKSRRLKDPLKQIGDLLDAGRADIEIAKMLGVAGSYVGYYRRKLGRPPTILSDIRQEERLRIVEMLLNKGIMQSDIARHLGISPNTVADTVRKLGRLGEKQALVRSRKEQVAVLLEQGMKPAQIAETLQVTIAALGRYLRDVRAAKKNLVSGSGIKE